MHTTHTIAEALGIGSMPEMQSPISRVSGLANATPDSIIFIEHESQANEALATSAAAILAPLNTQTRDTRILCVQQPRLAFAKAAQLLAPQTPAHIHPKAITGSATIGSNTSIAAGCVLGDRVIIGCDCTLHPNVTIYPGTTVGDRVIVHAGVVLGADGFGYVRDPASGAYLQFPQQGTLVIEDDVEIGASTTIDRGALDETRIGRGTKIDNLVHIGHNVRIGSDVVIAAQTGISGSCVVEDGAIIGGQVGMGDHSTIGAGAIIGSGAGILPHKHIQGPNQVFWGVPAKPLKQHLRELAALSKLAKTPRAGK